MTAARGNIDQQQLMRMMQRCGGKLGDPRKKPPRGGNSDLSAAFARQQPTLAAAGATASEATGRSRDGSADAATSGARWPRHLSTGLPVAAVRKGYQLANRMGAMLDADDALRRHEIADCAFCSLQERLAGPRILLALPLDVNALLAQCPGLAQRSDTVEWDETQGTLKAATHLHRSTGVKNQPLAETLGRAASGDAQRASAMGPERCVLNWTPEAEQLRLRLLCAAQWRKRRGRPSTTLRCWTRLKWLLHRR